MRTMLALLFTIASLPLNAAQPALSLEVDSTEQAQVRPGDIIGVTLRATFPQAFTGTVTIDLSVGEGATLTGATHVSPRLIAGECDRGLRRRICTGTVTIPAGGEIVTVQGVTIGADARGTVPYQAVVRLAAPNSTPVFVSKSLDFLVVRAPEVVLLGEPAPMLQQPGVAGAQASFGIANAGSEPTEVSLSGPAEFYEISPSRFSLAPGERRRIDIAGKAMPAGTYTHEVTLSGAGVASGSSVPVKLLSANRPSTRPEPVPVRSRIDAEEGTIDIQFRNRGTGTVRGLFSSDHPWLVAPSELFTMDGGDTAVAKFTIEPNRRSRFVPLGTVRTTLRLNYLLESASATGRIADASTGGVASTSVQVSSTKANAATPATIPPLAAGEVALLVPGVGRVEGSVGQFLSDVSFTAAERGASSSDVRLYFGTNPSSLLSSGNSVGGSFSLLYGDILQSVYKQDGQVGTLQVRSAIPGGLSVAAGIFNVSNDAGNYGTVVPAFRSDRAIGANEELVLTGVRKDDSGHTNFYLQESTGAPASALISWYSTTGAKLAERGVDLDAWGFAQLTDPSPQGTASARIQRTGGTGRVIGYATPVDRASGDTWAIADWTRFYGYSPSDPVIVPVAGSVRGANETFFRTDLAITAGSSAPAQGELRYTDRNGTSSSQTISVPAGNTLALSDVAGAVFGRSDAVGYLQWIPSSGSASISSRTYTTVSDAIATFGTAVPALPSSFALASGEYRRFGGFDDASIDTVVARVPGTSRTNFGLVEVGGAAATVKATLRYSYPGEVATAVGVSEKTYSLAPGAFLLVSNISAEIMGERRENFGDLSNLTVEFEVIEGSGRVLPFITSTDNGTGDSLLRTE